MVQEWYHVLGNSKHLNRPLCLNTLSMESSSLALTLDLWAIRSVLNYMSGQLHCITEEDKYLILSGKQSPAAWHSLNTKMWNNATYVLFRNLAIAWTAKRDPGLAQVHRLFSSICCLVMVFQCINQGCFLYSVTLRLLARLDGLVINSALT